MPIKISHLITSLHGGGTENFLYQIISRSPSGYDHEVIYLKENGVIGDRIRTLGIPVNAITTPFGLYRHLRRRRPEILHTCLYRAHQLGRIIGTLAGIQTIISSQRSIDLWESRWQTSLDRWTVAFCSDVVVNSVAAQHLVEKRLDGKNRPLITVIPNGVDIDRFVAQDKPEARRRFGLPENAILGGSLLRLHSEKGADWIPQLASELLPKIPSLHLVIGGLGPLSRSLQQQAAESPYRDRIHWLGWVDEAPTLFSALDFFWSISREESFPQTLLEASVTGLPWAAPNIGGIPELLAQGAPGTLFPPGDIPAAAEAMEKIIDQLAAYQTLARESAPLLRRRYAEKQMIDKVYGVFQAGRHAPRKE